jgi:phosphate transport system substrate-binding protein
MQDEEIRQVEQGVRMVPATAGMVVLAYNIWGLEGAIKLKRDVYVDIFWGKIKKWNDPRIKQSNPTLTLPKVDITPVVRLDSSGTTYAFTHHLSAISEAWRDAGPGVGKLIDWPGRAMVARGNAGVARRVKLSAGAIGYIEYSFAKRLGLPMAWLENKAGRFVKPDAQSGQLALAGGSAEPGHFRLFIPDPEGEASYPIITYSWLLLYDRYSDSAKVSVLKDFMWWGLTQGQDDSTALGYVPLPKEVVSRARSAVDKIHE